MAREIKFRCWDKDAERWLSDEFLIDASGVLCENECMTMRGDFVLEQYTSLKDTSGKEVYEGDIVRWDDASGGKTWRVAEVIAEPGHFTFRIIPSQCVGCFKDEPHSHRFPLGSFIYCPDIGEYGNIMEVIGNIHQNPELLK